MGPTRVMKRSKSTGKQEGPGLGPEVGRNLDSQGEGFRVKEQCEQKHISGWGKESNRCREE